MSVHEGGEAHTHAIGLRLLLTHFETVVERETRADHLHRKPVIFTCLRGALDLSAGPLPTPATVLLSTFGDLVGGVEEEEATESPVPTTTFMRTMMRFGQAALEAPQNASGGTGDSGVFAGFDTPVAGSTIDPAQAAATNCMRSAALSTVNVLRRVGLVVSEGELEEPCRRYVRRVGSEPSEMENVPNLWNQCPPPPGLLVVPDLHLPPF